MSSDEDVRQGLMRTAMLLDAQELEHLAHGAVRDTVLPPAKSAVQALRIHLSRLAGDPDVLPPPRAFREKVGHALQALKGTAPALFIDKLCERLAFERTSSRLYASLLLKTHTLGTFAGGPTPERLLELHNQELEHLGMVREGLLRFGAHPSLRTPSGDVASAQSRGLIQAVDAPGATLMDALRATLVSELINNAGWALLVDLASELGPPDLELAFRDVLHVESHHLAEVTVWVANGTYTDAPSTNDPYPVSL
ncbi:ferritin-like domain-containing protein [Corallococcus praedator]|uniref:Ferritin-like domain-containing protein n=1 Tax=Corallococcus praedator TaxID=2316724 RepID=A0ABX9QNK0_9BACT|nr:MULTISPECIES: ferritin-like domain-containing protein [Corallococcus]RKH34715.1 ferritin-like domain-containing protein [Corallococcus sp. CA031C]RKI14610.1 ferritin-like domain-containing protein [Corallococcus praedator]